MIEKVFVVENKKIKGIEKEREKVIKIIEGCGKVVENSIKNVDLVISLGGDGTLLKSFHLLNNKEVPIYGIKYGKVGFLTNSNKDIEKKLPEILNGKFFLSKRSILEAEIVVNGKKVKEMCLNDLFIFRKGIRIVEFSVEVESEKIYSMRADGILFSTPTGSTAHALSAGGPILSPELNCFLILPLFPHLLTTRPVILGENQTVKIKAGKQLSIVVDGQKEFISGDDTEINVKLSDKKCYIILDDNRFFSKLSSKFNWSK